MLGRTLFKTSTASGFRVEVLELLVGPRQRTGDTSFAGAAILDVRAGSGVVTGREKSREIKTGATLALSQGETFSVQNNGDAPIVITVHSFIAE